MPNNPNTLLTVTAGIIDTKTMDARMAAWIGVQQL
jgi:hypothetical protein